MVLTTVPSQYRLRVKQRLGVIEYALTYGVKPASRRFGLDHKTVRRWRDDFREVGVAGLVPRYPARRAPRLAPEVLELIRQARQERRYGRPGPSYGSGACTTFACRPPRSGEPSASWACPA